MSTPINKSKNQNHLISYLRTKLTFPNSNYKPVSKNFYNLACGKNNSLELSKENVSLILEELSNNIKSGESLKNCNNEEQLLLCFDVFKFEMFCSFLKNKEKNFTLIKSALEKQFDLTHVFDLFNGKDIDKVVKKKFLSRLNTEMSLNIEVPDDDEKLVKKDQYIKLMTNPHLQLVKTSYKDKSVFFKTYESVNDPQTKNNAEQKTSCEIFDYYKINLLIEDEVAFSKILNCMIYVDDDDFTKLINRLTFIPNNSEFNLLIYKYIISDWVNANQVLEAIKETPEQFLHEKTIKTIIGKIFNSVDDKIDKSLHLKPKLDLDKIVSFEEIYDLKKNPLEKQLTDRAKMAISRNITALIHKYVRYMHYQFVPDCNLDHESESKKIFILVYEYYESYSLMDQTFINIIQYIKDPNNDKNHKDLLSEIKSNNIDDISQINNVHYTKLIMLASAYESSLLCNSAKDALSFYRLASAKLINDPNKYLLQIVNLKIAKLNDFNKADLKQVTSFPVDHEICCTLIKHYLKNDKNNKQLVAFGIDLVGQGNVDLYNLVSIKYLHDMIFQNNQLFDIIQQNACYFEALKALIVIICGFKSNNFAENLKQIINYMRFNFNHLINYELNIDWQNELKLCNDTTILESYMSIAMHQRTSVNIKQEYLIKLINLGDLQAINLYLQDDRLILEKLFKAINTDAYRRKFMQAITENSQKNLANNLQITAKLLTLRLNQFYMAKYYNSKDDDGLQPFFLQNKSIIQILCKITLSLQEEPQQNWPQNIVRKPRLNLQKEEEQYILRNIDSKIIAARLYYLIGDNQNSKENFREALEQISFSYLTIWELIAAGIQVVEPSKKPKIIRGLRNTYPCLQDLISGEGKNSEEKDDKTELLIKRKYLLNDFIVGIFTEYCKNSINKSQKIVEFSNQASNVIIRTILFNWKYTPNTGDLDCLDLTTLAQILNENKNDEAVELYCFASYSGYISNDIQVNFFKDCFITFRRSFLSFFNFYESFFDPEKLKLFLTWLEKMFTCLLNDEKPSKDVSNETTLSRLWLNLFSALEEILSKKENQQVNNIFFEFFNKINKIALKSLNMKAIVHALTKECEKYNNLEDAKKLDLFLTLNNLTKIQLSILKSCNSPHLHLNRTPLSQILVATFDYFNNIKVSERVEIKYSERTIKDRTKLFYKITAKNNNNVPDTVKLGLTLILISATTSNPDVVYRCWQSDKYVPPESLLALFVVCNIQYNLKFLIVKVGINNGQVVIPNLERYFTNNFTDHIESPYHLFTNELDLEKNTVIPLYYPHYHNKDLRRAATDVTIEFY